VHSRNLVSIRLLRAVGTADVIEYASRFGFDPSTMPNNLTLALGTLSATPLEVATGYATFANGGYKVSPYFIERIENNQGVTVWRATPKEVCDGCGPGDENEPAPAADAPDAPEAAAPPPRASKVMTLAPPPAEQLPPLLDTARRAPRIITAANAWLMDNIMGDVIKRGTGVRARVLGREDISGKTGTTNESHDTWFNGFNPSLEATVWVGYDQEQSLGEGEEGSSVAVPIWVRLMREGLRGVPDVPRPMPPGLVTARVDASTGQLAPPGDSAAVSEFFFTDKLPAAATGPANPANTGTEPLF
jgi:penicillin-binding protein 1A